MSNTEFFDVLCVAYVCCRREIVLCVAVVVSWLLFIRVRRHLCCPVMFLLYFVCVCVDVFSYQCVIRLFCIALFFSMTFHNATNQHSQYVPLLNTLGWGVGDTVAFVALFKTVGNGIVQCRGLCCGVVLLTLLNTGCYNCDCDGYCCYLSPVVAVIVVMLLCRLLLLLSLGDCG